MTGHCIKLNSVIIALIMVISPALIIKNSDHGALYAKSKKIKIEKSDTPTRSDFLNPLNELNTAIKDHDKGKWLSLFSENASIEDPAGSELYGNAIKDKESHLDTFFQTNLSNYDITFKSAEDIVCGMDVFRDAEIKLVPDSGMQIKVNSYALYEMTNEGGKFKIARQISFWEVSKMTKQLTGNGFAGLKTALNLFWHRYRSQGIRETLAFIKGSSGISNNGYKTANEFADAFNNRDDEKMRSLFENKDSIVEFPANYMQYSAEKFIKNIEKKSKIKISDLRSAGWYTACKFVIEGDELNKRGIAVFHFDPKSKKITDAKFYWNQI